MIELPKQVVIEGVPFAVAEGKLTVDADRGMAKPVYKLELTLMVSHEELVESFQRQQKRPARLRKAMLELVTPEDKRKFRL